VAAWQQQCCGAPFRVGGRVEWLLTDDIDRVALAQTLGPETAARLTHAEDHHGALPEGTAPTTGTVRTISAAFCRYAVRDEERDAVGHPAPGTTVLKRRTDADGREPDSRELPFVGYVVELETTG
jgi:hypothetical protein